jgi:hypothetical protein
MNEKTVGDKKRIIFLVMTAYKPNSLDVLFFGDKFLLLFLFGHL